MVNNISNLSFLGIFLLCYYMYLNSKVPGLIAYPIVFWGLFIVFGLIPMWIWGFDNIAKEQKPCKDKNGE